MHAISVTRALIKYTHVSVMYTCRMFTICGSPHTRFLWGPLPHTDDTVFLFRYGTPSKNGGPSCVPYVFRKHYKNMCIKIMQSALVITAFICIAYTWPNTAVIEK
jgi:hypothetical protein